MIFPGLNIFFKVIFLVICFPNQFNTQIYVSNMIVDINRMSILELVSTENEICRMYGAVSMSLDAHEISPQESLKCHLSIIRYSVVIYLIYYGY